MSDPRSVGLLGEALLAHLTYEPVGVVLAAIPWPEGLAPTPQPLKPRALLPHADVLVVTWTAAEWQALADVLTPGHDKTQWAKYTENWSRYEKQLTWKSPAKEAGCIADYALTQIGSQSVLCVHSQLHLATDDVSAPVIDMWEQIIAEVEPSLVITTGTAGGIGASTVLGDVFVVSNAKFNCTRMFKDELWAQERYESAPYESNSFIALAQATLLTINAPKLRPVATRNPVITVGGDVETLDFFGFDDTDDSYGVRSNDPLAHTEEMDDATLWLALDEMESAIPCLSIRNASDPEIASSIGTLQEQSKWASNIYERYGYYTSVGSAITVWAVIADLD